MRVTAETKERTREGIVGAARKLFSDKGFDQTTTRNLAREAGIAAGTLFNYFASKEALALHLVAEALLAARRDFDRGRRGNESLAEDLFRHIMAALRRLEPNRSFVGAVIETVLSPFRESGVEEARMLRQVQLETLAELLRMHGLRDKPSFVAVHLYWTLYVGVLAFWSRDPSPHQEATLAVLDQSVRLFVSSLRAGPDLAEESCGT